MTTKIFYEMKQSYERIKPDLKPTPTWALFQLNQVDALTQALKFVANSKLAETNFVSAQGFVVGDNGGMFGYYMVTHYPHTKTDGEKESSLFFWVERGGSEADPTSLGTQPLR